MSLYILTADILAINIRANPSIEGLRLPQDSATAKLSQYADDTRNDQSIHHTFNTLKLYKSSSGAKINREKCQGLWSGSLKHRTDSPLNVKWYHDYLPDKILGLFFGNIDCTTHNLEPRIKKSRTRWKPGVAEH